ncbi:hypothetical protein MAH1_15340 [Sessilibacter sp. MAH1]
MDKKKPSITKTSTLDQNKIKNAKGLSKKEKIDTAAKQERKLKISKSVIQEFEEWR